VIGTTLSVPSAPTKKLNAEFKDSSPATAIVRSAIPCSADEPRAQTHGAANQRAIDESNLPPEAVDGIRLIAEANRISKMIKTGAGIHAKGSEEHKEIAAFMESLPERLRVSGNVAELQKGEWSIGEADLPLQWTFKFLVEVPLRSSVRVHPALLEEYLRWKMERSSLDSSSYSQLEIARTIEKFYTQPRLRGDLAILRRALPEVHRFLLKSHQSVASAISRLAQDNINRYSGDIESAHDSRTREDLKKIRQYSENAEKLSQVGREIDDSVSGLESEPAEVRLSFDFTMYAQSPPSSPG
jgi:hypothetical protein